MQSVRDAASPIFSYDNEGSGSGLARSHASAAFARATVVPVKALKESGKPKKQQNQISAEKVLQSFNTWAFKREQPSDPHLMLNLISESIALQEPIHFVLYWGKGLRTTLHDLDVDCLSYLSGMRQRITEVYKPGAIIKLIFTDTHALHNGHTPEHLTEYFGAVEKAARERGFDTCWLGELTGATELKTMTQSPQDAISDDTLRRLFVSAAKWYRGDGSSELGAMKYYQMNMLEKRAVQLAFPNSIFVTFNGSKFRNLFPEKLPIFYMYSLKRGFSVKPWFLPAVGTGQNQEDMD